MAAVVLLGVAGLSCGFSATGEVGKDGLPPALLDQLTLTRSNLELIEQLRQQGVEVDADGAIARRLLGDVTRLTDGRVTTLVGLRSVTGSAPNRVQRRRGWFTFADVLWLLGGLVVVVAIVTLLRHYLERLFKRVPAWVWEIAFYAACAGALLAGAVMPVGFHLATVLPGCFGLVGALAYSCRRHSFRHRDLVIWVLVAVWSGVAWYYGSETVGFFAVMAVLVGLGFMAGFVPGLLQLGFRGTEVIPRTTVAAGLLLAAHVALHCTGLAPVGLAPFRAGMGFLGAFVYLLGLLILASRHYVRREWSGAHFWLRFGAMQALTLASGVAVLYFGSVYGVPNLLGLGGTFFCLFLLEKYYDLPWQGIGWVWSLLGVGALLYAFALFVQARPEWFFFMR